MMSFLCLPESPPAPPTTDQSTTKQSTQGGARVEVRQGTMSLSNKKDRYLALQFSVQWQNVPIHTQLRGQQDKPRSCSEPWTLVQGLLRQSSAHTHRPTKSEVIHHCCFPDGCVLSRSSEAWKLRGKTLINVLATNVAAPAADPLPPPPPLQPPSLC